MRLLVLDGNSIINRAFYGIKLLSTKDGLYTNALFGFMNILQKLRETTDPDHIAVAFDLSAPTFRHSMFDAYKAGRKGMPEELRQQMPILKELLPLLGCTVVEKEGYEADDILGTLAAAASAAGGECFIATGDRDSLQLVDDHVTVLLAATKMGRPETTVFDRAAIGEKYGLVPEQLIDLKALMGDSSDNIPGVPGVGEKTALDLMHRFGSLDAIYANIDSPDIRDAVRRKLIDGKESAYLSQKLGTICCTAPIDTSLETYAVKPLDKEPLAVLLARLEFFKMMDKLDLNNVSVTPAEAVPSAPALTFVAADEADKVFAAAKSSGNLDIVTAFADGKPQSVAVIADKLVTVFHHSLPDQLLTLLTDKTVAKRTHDSKPLFAWMLHNEREPRHFTMDTLLAGYLLNPLASDYTLEHLAQEYRVSVTVPETEDAFAAKACLFPAVCAALEKEIAAQNQGELLNEVEIPLALVLADMENCGVAVDADGLQAFGNRLGEQIEHLQKEIYTAVGYEFNLNSPKQLGKALFEDLGLPAKKKTKSGYSTNAEVLESLKDAHPAVAMLLEYRTLAKLKSTYCDGLFKVVAEDGRIHSSFNQTETRTGRISSTDPNLQNIPVRSELGRELRRFFRAKKGWILCDADYSQIELRVMAHMADEHTMIDAFNHDEDIHRITASQVFDVPEELVTPLMRSSAKAVNFGIIYGIGAHSLSEDLGVSYGEAKRYISGYLEHYSKVAGFMDDLIAAAKEKGYGETLYHRRRPLPELKSSNGITRSFGERVARNMPIQGTAADIIKIAMVRVFHRLRRENMQARLILQVHDELIVEAPLNEAEKAALILQEEMESAATMQVKLAVDVHTGETWYDAKG